jgi:Predicted transcriptional regulator
MLTGKELGAAIERARVAKKVSKKKLAEDFGVAAPSVQGWVKTGRIDKSKLMELMEYFADVAKPEHWGLGERISNFISTSAKEGNKEQKESNVIAVDFSKKPDSEGYVTIPRFAVSGSMGPGQIPPEGHIDIIRDITVHLGWLAKRGVNYSKLENLAIITGDGDSMEGTFNDGASLLIDMGITQIKTDAIYVFSLDGDLFIKRLQRITGKSLSMISDNPVYRPVELTGSQLERMHIHARVLLAWDVKKL